MLIGNMKSGFIIPKLNRVWNNKKKLEFKKKHINLKIWHIHNRQWYFLLKFMYVQVQGAGATAIDFKQLGTRMHAGRPFVLPYQSSTQFLNSFIYVGRPLWNQL